MQILRNLIEASYQIVEEGKAAIPLDVNKHLISEHWFRWLFGNRSVPEDAATDTWYFYREFILQGDKKPEQFPI